MDVGDGRGGHNSAVVCGKMKISTMVNFEWGQKFGVIEET
jgi:hypothetical protein